MSHIPFRRMWGPAILIGVLTAVGLLSALLGDGIWDWLSALLLSLPVFASAWFARRRVSVRQTLTERPPAK